jgi:UDP-N-acetylmuramyl pentapeptide synthase
MGELGHHAIEGHRSVGRHAAQLKIDAVFTVGGEASLISDEAKAGGLCESLHFASQEACAAHLKRVLKPGDAVLLKGSRSAGMEKVLTHYLNS